MTPTEQDKELEAQLDKIFPCDCSFKKGFAFKPGDPCDGSCVNAPYRKAVLELITADRKRVALKARINELEKFVNTTNRSLSVKKLRDRLSALKAQQEEKHGRNG